MQQGNTDPTEQRLSHDEVALILTLRRMSPQRRTIFLTTAQDLVRLARQTSAPSATAPHAPPDQRAEN